MEKRMINQFYRSIFLLTLSALFLITGENIARSQSEHTITINNYCTDNIWVGSFTAAGTINSVTNNTTALSTFGGWEMATNTSATVKVSTGWSGRFWPRTGCSFITSGTDKGKCPAAGPGDDPPADCCDTGGCKINGKDFGLECTLTGNPPATLAEFTVTDGGQDNYDISLVDGGNIPVDIIPDSSTYDCSDNTSCIFTNNLPNKNSPECTSDSDCSSIFGPNSTASWKCQIDKTTPANSRCVNPFFCGSAGCSDTNGCAPVGLTQSLLPSSPWAGSTSKESEHAIAESSCPAGSQFTDSRGRGTDYVGCIAPQKFCRISCSTDEDCPMPFKCGTDFGVQTPAYCGTCTMPGASMSTCDQFEVWGNDCDATVSGTTKEDLWACTGTNATSCFSAGAGTTCCGCPPWAPGFPSGACQNNNSNWQTVAEPIASVFNAASPTAYSFAFDDFIKLFTCQSVSGGALTNYTINFCCVNVDGDGNCNQNDSDADNDGIRDVEETFGALAVAKDLTVQQGLDLNDFDGDGITNEFDLDSDGDGIPDHFECNGENDSDQDGRSDNFADQDADGHHDLHDESTGGEALNCVDTDGDGNPDFIDHDSDDDGLTDAEEAGGLDLNVNGIHDLTEDTNRDGLADDLDPETGTPLEITDSDGDGTPDFRDAQISGDGNCSLAASGTRGASVLVYLLIPAILVFRRYIKRN